MGRLKKPRQQQNIINIKKSNFSFKIGWFTALKVLREEVAINDLVLRVPLISCQKKFKEASTVKCLINPNVKSINLNKHTSTAASPKVQMSHTNNPLKPLRTYSRKSYSSPKVKINNGTKLKNKVFQLKMTTPLQQFQSKLTVDFMELSDLLNLLKLPSPLWEVKVLMNHDLTTMFQFINSNKVKCVMFSQLNPKCNISMNNVPVILLGCPETIDSLQDIEILLEIVDRLDRKDSMVIAL